MWRYISPSYMWRKKKTKADHEGRTDLQRKKDWFCVWINECYVEYTISITRLVQSNEYKQTHTHTCLRRREGGWIKEQTEREGRWRKGQYKSVFTCQAWSPQEDGERPVIFNSQLSSALWRRGLARFITPESKQAERPDTCRINVSIKTGTAKRKKKKKKTT